MPEQAGLERQRIHAIRFPAVDAVPKAQSGYPGTPMGPPTMAYTLWDRLHEDNPRNPTFPNRDRFILSARHVSMLSYARPEATRHDRPLNELEDFGR